MPPIKTETELEERLSRPSDADAAAMAALEGDIMILGAGGKMGPSLARLRRSIRESEPTQYLRTLQVFGATLASASSWARAPEGVGNEPAWFVGKMDGSGNGWSIPDGGDRLVRRHDRLSPNPKIIQAANA